MEQLLFSYFLYYKQQVLLCQVGREDIMDLGNCVLVILFWPYFLHWYPSQCGEDVLRCLYPSQCTRTRTTATNKLDQRAVICQDKLSIAPAGGAGSFVCCAGRAGSGQLTLLGCCRPGSVAGPAGAFPSSSAAVGTAAAGRGRASS